MYNIYIYHICYIYYIYIYIIYVICIIYIYIIYIYTYVIYMLQIYILYIYILHICRGFKSYSGQLSKESFNGECYFLLNDMMDLMDLNLLSLDALVPEALCYVFYTTSCQVYCRFGKNVLAFDLT